MRSLKNWIWQRKMWLLYWTLWENGIHKKFLTISQLTLARSSYKELISAKPTHVIFHRCKISSPRIFKPTCSRVSCKTSLSQDLLVKIQRNPSRMRLKKCYRNCAALYFCKDLLKSKSNMESLRRKQQWKWWVSSIKTWGSLLTIWLRCLRSSKRCNSAQKRPNSSFAV